MWHNDAMQIEKLEHVRVFKVYFNDDADPYADYKDEADRRKALEQLISVYAIAKTFDDVVAAVRTAYPKRTVSMITDGESSSFGKPQGHHVVIAR